MTLTHADVYQCARPLVIGDRRRLERRVLWARSGEDDYDETGCPNEGCYEKG